MTEVTLAGVDAELADVSECGLIEVIAQEYGAEVTGDVRTVSDSGAITVKENAWSYIAAGTNTAVAPAAGQDGTFITIDGESLFGGGNSVKAVTLAGVSGFVEEQSDTQLIVRAFPGPSDGEVGDIVITGSSGVTVRLVDGWTYSGVQAVTPNYGNRGTLVEITTTLSSTTGESVLVDNSDCAATAADLNVLLREFRGPPLGDAENVGCAFGTFLFDGSDCDATTATLNAMAETWQRGGFRSCAVTPPHHYRYHIGNHLTFNFADHQSHFDRHNDGLNFAVHVGNDQPHLDAQHLANYHYRYHIGNHLALKLPNHNHHINANQHRHEHPHFHTTHAYL